MASTDDPTKELMEAVLARLTGDSALQTLFGGTVPLGEHVTEQRAFPYLELLHVRTDPDEMDDVKAWAVFLQINGWTQEKTSTNLRQWMRRIRELLDGITSYAVTGHALVNCEITTDVAARGDRGRTHTAAQRYRFYLEEA